MTGRKGPGRPEEIRPGLERILAAFEISGHPERAFRVLHVAGTNGKGSTASFAERIVRGFSLGPVGLFTSPHLVSPEERIRVDGRKIPREALSRALRKAAEFSDFIAAACGAPLSYFEEMTWAGCDWFRRKTAWIAVMEAGLGGRWDATNACMPAVSVITTIGIDHREWLGRTLGEIASEKAGILRPDVPAVIGRLKPAARSLVVRRAGEVGAPLWELGRDFLWEEGGRGRIRIRLPGLTVPATRVGMAGEFQRDNATVACAAAWRLAVSGGIGAAEFVKAARRGIESARWPGRFSRLPGRGNAGAWVDGAHNPDAARALSRELSKLKERGRAGRIIALWSMLRDKDAHGFLREMKGAVDGWVVFPLEHERAAFTKDLAAACRRKGVACRVAETFQDGWRDARDWAGRSGMVIVCGSLMAAGEAFRYRVGEIA
ncbi:MAG: bifunctional folylpolyglutamate synthase/dihydrofolate synthase [Deltaproteobacteria bacterium]|nr:bifunctional folylpolyglutamate synthase/dihydrofolate synthase [Deltaproteobacteria bacterium]